MSFRLLALCILLLHGVASAQSILYSPYEKFDLRAGDYSVIGKVGGRIYTYRSSSDGYFLDAFDDGMNRKATVVLDFFPEKIYETRFIAYPDKIIVLYQATGGSAVTQYAALLDATGRLQGRPLTLAEQKTGLFGASGDYFYSAVSDDKRRIAVYTANAKGAKLHIAHTILNDSLRAIQRSESNYAGDATLDVQPGIVDNAGAFYLPVTTNTGSRDYADGVWLLSLPFGNGGMTVQELPLEGAFASGLFFKADYAARRVYAGGFYSPKRSGNYDGILLATFSIGDTGMASVRRTPFDERIRLASGERSSRRAFNDYGTRQLIVRADGGFVLLAEQYYVSVRTGGAFSPYGGYYTPFYTPYMGGQNVREYHFGDVLAVSCNAAGEREWNAFVRKEQYSQDDAGAFSSYAFINTGGALGFLYNDFDSRRSRITLATMDESGKTDIHTLDAGGIQQTADWLPRAGRQVSAHELVVPCLRRRSLCFAKVVF